MNQLKMTTDENLSTLRAKRDVLLAQSYEIGHQLIEIGGRIREQESKQRRYKRRHKI